MRNIFCTVFCFQLAACLFLTTLIGICNSHPDPALGTLTQHQTLTGTPTLLLEQGLLSSPSYLFRRDSFSSQSLSPSFSLSFSAFNLSFHILLHENTHLLPNDQNLGRTRTFNTGSSSSNSSQSNNSDSGEFVIEDTVIPFWGFVTTFRAIPAPTEAAIKERIALMKTFQLEDTNSLTHDGEYGWVRFTLMESRAMDTGLISHRLLDGLISVGSEMYEMMTDKAFSQKASAAESQPMVVNFRGGENNRKVSEESKDGENDHEQDDESKGDDVEGEISTNGKTRKPQWVIYRFSDYVRNAESSSSFCGTDELLFENYFADTGLHPIASDHIAFDIGSGNIGEKGQKDGIILDDLPHAFNDGHSNEDDESLDTKSKISRRALTGCPLEYKALYVGMAADCTYIAKYGGQSAAQAQIISNINKASGVYMTTFNVILSLLTLSFHPTCGDTTWNQLCSNSYTISQRLSDFSEWRGSQDDTAGLWHLMSTCSTGSTVGVAWVNMLCKTSPFQQVSNGSTQWVAGVAVTAAAENEWLVVSHEIGHNFGARHDCTSGTCPLRTGGSSDCCSCGSSCDCQGLYIMNPTSNALSTSFSGCSISEICSKNLLLGTCLETPGSRASITGMPSCGNGIREGTEQCDCGGTLGCAADPCCNTNCTYTAGSVCDNVNDACCVNCQINKNTSHICRPKVASNDCDKPEYCSGNNASCPADTYQQNGMACSYNDTSTGTVVHANCASGLCTSRQLYCKIQGQLYNQPDFETDCPEFSGQCQLFCYSPIENCALLGGNSGQFLDGIPCGNNGYCYSGICSNPDFIGQIVQWSQANLILVLTLGGILSISLMICYNVTCTRAQRIDLRRAYLARQQDAKMRQSQELSLKPEKAVKPLSNSDQAQQQHQNAPIHTAQPQPQQPQQQQRQKQQKETQQPTQQQQPPPATKTQQHSSTRQQPASPTENPSRVKKPVREPAFYPIGDNARH